MEQLCNFNNFINSNTNTYNMEYNNFVIKNHLVKQIIDDFNESIHIKFNIFSENFSRNNNINQNLEELESLIGDLKLLIDKKDILEIDTNTEMNIKSKSIEQVIKSIMYYYLEQCSFFNDIISKGKINGLLCEIFIKYSFVFKIKSLENILENIKKYMISRCVHLSVNHGCIISWLTFATLCPEMTNDNLHLKINVEGPLYKNINWEYLDSKKELGNQLIAFYKYNSRINELDFNGVKLHVSYV